MSELDEKLGAILGNPQLMQQIQSMAQSLGGGPEESAGGQDNTAAVDPQMMKNILGMIRQGNGDHNQEALLHALSPYLSPERVNKLERAMRTARMAGAASSFLNAGGLQMLTGR